MLLSCCEINNDCVFCVNVGVYRFVHKSGIIFIYYSLRSHNISFSFFFHSTFSAKQKNLLFLLSKFYAYAFIFWIEIFSQLKIYCILFRLIKFISLLYSKLPSIKSLSHISRINGNRIRRIFMKIYLSYLRFFFKFIISFFWIWTFYSF